MSQRAGGVPRTPSDRKHSSPVKPLSEKRSRPSSAPRTHTLSHNRYSSPSTTKAKPNPADLYEDLLVLKTELAYLKDQNSLLKAKLLRSEIDSNRDEKPANPLFGSSLQRAHLVSSLKHTIQQLKSELKLKENETFRLKRDMKVSRTAELEVELQAYIDECMRLRHHIEEVLVKRLGTSESADALGNLEEIVRNLAEHKANLEKKVGNLQGELDSSKEEIRKLEGKLKLQPNFQDLQSKIRTLSSQNDQNTTKIKSLEAQLASSKAEIAQLTSKLAANPRPQASFPSIQATSMSRPPAPGPELDDSKYEISIREEEKGDSDACEQTLIAEIEQSRQRPLLQFVEKCKKAVLGASERVKREVMEALSGESPVAEEVYEAITEAGVVTSIDEVATFIDQLPIQLLPSLKSLQNSTASASQSTLSTGHAGDLALQKALKVLSYRLQLHRIPRPKLAEVLFGPRHTGETDISFAELMKILGNSPCNVAEIDECKVLAVYLLGGTAAGSSKAGRLKEVTARLLSGLDDWEVYSTEDESEFDHHISSLITENMQDFLTLCKQKDPRNTGEITMQALTSICSTLRLPFNPSEFHYMELLFFSLNFQLDQVPYEKFIQAYVSEEPHTDSEAEIGEEEDRQRLVQHYLCLIADQLTARKLSIAQVFPSQEGILYPDSLVAGLKKLNIPALKKEELVVFLDTLQSEELEEYGIDVRLFADLIRECGEESSREWGSDHSF